MQIHFFPDVPEIVPAYLPQKNLEQSVQAARPICVRY